MATIKFYPDGPMCPDTMHTVTVQHLADWLVNHAPKHDKLYFWHEQISVDSAVTDISDAQLLDTDAMWYISAVPAGPETWIPVIIAIVVAVAATLLLTPTIPEVDANANRSSNNALQGRSNQPRLNKRLPDIRGREPACYPDLWMNYTRFVSNQEFEISYLCASVGQLDIEEATVVDGDTPLSRIDGAAAMFYNPYTSPNSGSPFLTIGDTFTDPLYAVEQANEVDGATLIAPNENQDTGPFLARSTGRIDSINATVPFYGDSFAIGDTCVVYNFVVVTPDNELADCSGSYTVTAVGDDYLVLDVSGASGSWIHYGAGGSAVPTSVWYDSANDLWYETEQPGTMLVEFLPAIGKDISTTVGPFTVSGFEKCWINIVAQNGFYKKGTQYEYFDMHIYVLFTDLDNPANTTAYNEYISPNGTDAVGVTIEYVIPYTNCSIEVRRMTETDFEFSGTVVDEIKWRDLFLANSVTVADFGNVTTILARTKATQSALRVKERKLSFACTRYITRPDSTYIASDEVADVLYSMHTDPFIGRRTSATIDHAGLYELQESIVDYFGTRDAIRVGYTFDDDTFRYEDHIALICDATNMSAYQEGNLIKFWWEGPQSISVQQFGHRSKLPVRAGGEERRTRSLKNSKDYDGVELTFKNENTGDTDTIYIPTDQSATNPNQITLQGCNVPQFAEVRAWREYNKLKYQRISHVFTAMDKARLLSKGQRVDVIDNTRQNSIDGYIDQTDGLRYFLSQPHEIAIGDATWSIVLTKRDGSLEGIPVTADPDTDEAVVLAYAPSEPPYVGYLADKTEYSLSTDDQRTKLAMLVQTFEPSDVDNVKVTCINYDERYYQDDLSV